MTHLEVLRAGIHAGVQDLGRPGHRDLGVPLSGALDPLTLELANALVGNPPGAGAIELLYGGITLCAREGAVRFAFGGTTGRLACHDGTLRDIPPWRSAVLGPDDTLTLAAPSNTAAAYLAIEGGFALAPVLGSVATYAPGQLGGWQGRLLLRGDRLPLVATAPTPGRERMMMHAFEPTAPALLRIMAGPQHARFVRGALDALTGSPYRVTPSSNRTGLRLDGALLQHAAGHDLLSEGVTTGSLQVPGSGQPVLLIADHPTVGGYPKIATVIGADLAAAGRLRIGASVRFALVDESHARIARIAASAERAALLASIRHAD